MKAILDKLKKLFNFSDEQLYKLERFKKETLQENIDFAEKESFDLMDFKKFELHCLVKPQGIRRDLDRDDIYWSIDIYYKNFTYSKEEIACPHRYYFYCKQAHKFLDKIRHEPIKDT